MMRLAAERASQVLATILLIACLGHPVAHAQNDAAPTEAIRVMSFNIRYGTAQDGDNAWPHRREMVFDVIRDHQPDIVGMQEVLNGQRAELLRALPEYESLGTGRFDGMLRGEFSLIMYRKDRLEVLQHGQFWLSDTPDVPGSKSWGNSITRICTWARMRDSQTGRSFYFYNTHLDHRSPPSQQRSAELIAQRIAMHEHKHVPVIMTGDFNANESTSTIRFLKGEIERAFETTTDPPPSPKLRDSFRLMHPEATNVGTFNGFRGESSRGKIDYVFVSDGVQAISAEIVQDNTDGRYPSDHFPVKATVRLENSDAE